MREEYDFTKGVRGRHHQSMECGFTITVHGANGTAEVKEIKPREGLVVLAPDVRDYFPDSESVNTTLRSLIKLIPVKRSSTNRGSSETDTKEHSSPPLLESTSTKSGRDGLRARSLPCPRNPNAAQVSGKTEVIATFFRTSILSAFFGTAPKKPVEIF